MLCKKKNNRIEGVPVYCKKSSLHLSGRNNKIIFGKNCNIVNCRIKLYGNSTLVLGDDCYFENTLIMLRDSEARFGNNTEASKVTVTSTGNSLLDLGAGSVICGEFDMRNQGIIRAKRLWTTWGPHIAANHGLIEFGDGGTADSIIYNSDFHPMYDLCSSARTAVSRPQAIRSMLHSATPDWNMPSRSPSAITSGSAASVSSSKAPDWATAASFRPEPTPARRFRRIRWSPATRDALSAATWSGRLRISRN